jgi:hypothetical protein
MKAHLIRSEVPLREGQDYTAICGTVVPRAAFVRISEDETIPTLFGKVLNQFNTCNKCLELVKDLGSGLIYGIIPDERHAQRGS